MTHKTPFLSNHNPSKTIGRFTESGIEFNDGLTPENFQALAFAVAGPRWRTQIGPMIGRCRTQIWEYANGERKVPEPVAKLMTMMAMQIASHLAQPPHSDLKTVKLKPTPLPSRGKRKRAVHPVTGAD